MLVEPEDPELLEEPLLEFVMAVVVAVVAEMARMVDEGMCPGNHSRRPPETAGMFAMAEMTLASVKAALKETAQVQSSGSARVAGLAFWSQAIHRSGEQ